MTTVPDRRPAEPAETDVDPGDLTIMSPEEWMAAYERVHGHPPPDPPSTGDTLPVCECRPVTP